jgi:trimethylamine-N-oxide reductase (cytochrome c)
VIGRGNPLAAKKNRPKTRQKRVHAGEKVSQGTEKTVLKALGLSGGMFGAAPCAVDVRDGKIVRIRPLHYDSKYDPKQFNPWKITKNGKTLRPLMKAVPSPFSLAYKKRVYSPNRIKYPLKRVD